MAKQAYSVFNKLGTMKQALMRVTAGECGRDSAHCARATVEAVARMDRPGPLAHDDSNEATLLCAPTLHNSVSPTTTPDYPAATWQKSAPVARSLYGINPSHLLWPTESLRVGATREDAVVMEGDYRPMK